MSKEKYLSESTIKETPKQRFSIKLKDGSITSDKITDGAITTPKIKDSSVTKEKLSEDVQNTLNNVGGKFDKSSIVQSIGLSEDKVMSQKAVTDELKDIHDTTDNIISVMVKNGFNIDLASSRGWSFRYKTISEPSVDGSYKAFTTLSAEAKFYALNVTDKITNINWTRNTENPEADAAWNKAHTNCGLSIPISYTDLGGDIYQIGHAEFTCTAEYNAEGDMYVAQKSVSF